MPRFSWGLGQIRMLTKPVVKVVGEELKAPPRRDALLVLYLLRVTLVPLNPGLLITRGIIVAGTVEVDDVAGSRILQHTEIRSQGAFLNGRKLHVAVSALIQSHPE